MGVFISNDVVEIIIEWYWRFQEVRSRNNRMLINKSIGLINRNYCMYRRSLFYDDPYFDQPAFMQFYKFVLTNVKISGFDCIHKL